MLLFPDASKSKVTVNMTVFAGSRHEGYGEAGMAHLLEHMLFKGTPTHTNIPELLSNRGANFNGTTWLDRTNYYETLPASSPQEAQENLEFAIQLEADRCVNSVISAEDFASEMTVVRNEFERGENNPVHILRQRVYAAAYDWHGYGRSTIGNRSDIERVPVEKLREFYRKFYRPDNVLLVVAGKFEEQAALDLAEKHFGSLASPSSPLDQTYTVEPAQDGERQVVLRRVGNAQFAFAAYHVPAGAHQQYAAIEMLAYIFGIEPSGRLYQSLVVPGLASGVTTNSLALHDPGMMTFGCQVPTSGSLQAAQQELLKTIESVAENPIHDVELNRAKAQFERRRDLRAAKTEQLAIELSEWAAQGDWRLYFWFRDAVESVTKADCQEAAAKYLTQNNRTLGLFYPTEQNERVEVPAKPDLEQLLAGYRGGAGVPLGEEFDPAAEHVESRVTRGTLACGLKTAWLPKKTRGGSVHLLLHLRFGNEDVLTPLKPATDFLPQMMMRGTTELDYQQIQDRLAELRSSMRMSGTHGVLSTAIETKRKYLPDVVELLSQILKRPRFDATELDVIRTQTTTSIQASMTEPNALAPLNVRRRLAPFGNENLRYIFSLEERIAACESMSAQRLQELHTLLAADSGEIAVVGDFDIAELQELLDSAFADWTSPHEFRRIPQPAQNQVPGGLELVATPGKDNAVYYCNQQIELRDDHEDYPGVFVANDILGESSLASRLGNRVRGQEGLSYGIGSGLHAHAIDHRATFLIYGITSPQNRDRFLDAIREEVVLLCEEGVTEKELAESKHGILQSRVLERTEDANLARQLAYQLFAGRTMEFQIQLESAVANLNVEQVTTAFRKHIQPEQFVAAFAGETS